VLVAGSIGGAILVNEGQLCIDNDMRHGDAPR
jgi:hypothetical protein